jgi:two-component system, NarL family, nitrate/nitrite response regulator NarL
MAGDAQIRVLVADRHPIFRDGLARAVRQDTELRLVGDVEDAGRALDAIKRTAPDVAVLDAELDGLRILGAVGQQRLGTRVALLASDVRPDIALDAVAAGARGYLSKRVRADVVCDAVRRIAAGGTVLCDDAQTVVSAELRLRHANLLPRREYEVLVLMADSLSYAEIGARLHIAPPTVKTYAARIYERLGARDRVGAVVEAMRRGILD